MQVLGLSGTGSGIDSIDSSVVDGGGFAANALFVIVVKTTKMKIEKCFMFD